MKHKYFCLILITFLSFNKVNSQACPENSFIIASIPEEVLFVFDLPGSPCVDRPGAIVIDGSAYILGNCDTFSSRYQLASGSGVIDPNSYTVTYGSSTCNYTNGVLGIDDVLFINNKTLQIYPNPIRNTNMLNMKFDLNMSAKINVYNLTGKLVLRDQINNSKFKEINISSLANGFYLLRLETDNASITKKFIIQN
jgi:Secretion system C-terminal sorting domain